MKKFLLTIAMLSSVAVMAQDKPLNPGFEDWTGVPLVDEAPDFYLTTGQLLESFFGTPVPGAWVTKSTTSRSEGLYSVKLTTDTVAGFGAIPGFIFSNTKDSVGEDFFAQLGFPFSDTSKRVVALKGSYRSDIKANDTVNVAVLATYYDEDAEERIIIGGGQWFNNQTQATFQNFTVNVDYEFDLLPDTIVIIGASGSFEGESTAGTSLWLDNFSYELAAIPADTTDTTTSIKTVMLTSASVYPNPTVDVVNVKMNESVSPNAVVTVFDAIGRKTYNRSYTVSNNEIRFNVADLMNGYYIINIVDNGKMYTKSFLKK